MKKNYILLSGLVLASCIGYAQNALPTNKFNAPPVEKALTSTPLKSDADYTKNSLRNKAVGDTLFYDSLSAASVAANWTIVNNNANNFQWEHNTVYQNGQFSMNQPAIASTSAADGFMSLPADFYNTPIPGTGAVQMDTYFESPTITIPSTPAVWLSYQQSMRYCCSGANRLVVQVSNDNFITFEEIDASNDIDVNAGSGTFTNIINISSVAANQTSIKFRFLSEGNSHYYWMIDDIAVIEGSENDLQLDDPYMEFHGANYAINPFYGAIPYSLFPPLPFSGNIYNNGSNTATTVSLDVDVTHTAGPAGGAGNGLVYSTSAAATTGSSVAGNLDSDSTTAVLTGAPEFVPTVLGDFQVDFLANMDSADQWSDIVGIESFTQAFATSDTSFYRHDNAFGAGVGPASYTRNQIPGGTNVGDKFGTLVIVEPNPGVTQLQTIPTSVSYWVSDDVRNIGVEIVPKVWLFDEDSATIAAAFVSEVASSFIPYTVTAADTMTELTLALDAGTAVLSGLTPGQYVVGWEVTSIAGGTTFEVRNDASSAAFQPNVSNFVDLAHAPGWGWTDDNPGIELNMAGLPIPTGLDNSSSFNVNFEVSPNPNNGEFNLSISSETQVTYNLVVRNMLGQSIQNGIINVNGQVTERIDLTKFEKGVYFVSLENDSEKLVKKVVVK